MSQLSFVFGRENTTTGPVERASIRAPTGPVAFFSPPIISRPETHHFDPAAVS
jgi:hypothetical protein